VTVADNYLPRLTGRPLRRALCDYAASNLENTGVVRRFYPIRMAEITDGTSNTLLLGDKRMNLSRLGQPQTDDNEGYTAGWDHDTVRYTRRDHPPAPDFTGNGLSGDRFGSSHTGVFNTVFADGSVHVLRYTIEPVIFSYLGDKSDGQVVSGTDF
jgi:prepilin-type processing-associated H-X9-DG protein